MKPRKIFKKLLLNKETISNLKEIEMDAVHAGKKDSSPTYCNSCELPVSYCPCTVPPTLLCY